MFLLLPPAGIDYHKAKMEHTDRLITTELMRLVSESVCRRKISLESQFCADRVGRLLNTLLSLLLFLNSLDFILSSFPSCPMEQAYTEELVDLHRRLMALRERNVLQQVCVRAKAKSPCDALILWAYGANGCRDVNWSSSLSDRQPDRGDGPFQCDQHHLWLWPLFTGRVHRPQTTELPGGDHVTGSGSRPADGGGGLVAASALSRGDG